MPHCSSTRPRVLPLREQAATVDRILLKRFDTLLGPVMREADIDMWLIICHEDNHDPIFDTITPWRCWAPILQIVAFYDPGDGRPIERINISRTNMAGLIDGIWHPTTDTLDQWQRLSEVVRQRSPRRIGINESATIWAADGLSASLKAKLIETLGEPWAGKLVSAEHACVRWLETRIPEELELYEHACALSRSIIRHCFSRQVITPGVTTDDDWRWAYWQQVADLGLSVSFPPFFRRFRSPAAVRRWGEEDPYIRKGDLLHCDVGLRYLRLCTDHQELAYVLRPNETAPPTGLAEGLRQANRLQDIFTTTWAEGLTGNEILHRALEAAREAKLPDPRIYSHAMGHFLHEPGPLMGLPWEQEHCPGRGELAMHPNTVYTVELSITQPVPEWEDQPVRIMVEQDAAFTAQGVHYIAGRQTELHTL